MRILILLLVVMGGCSRGETSDPSKRRPEPPAEKAAAPIPEAPPDDAPKAPPSDEGQPAADKSASALDLDAPPSVELLDAGKPPRKALQTTFEPGAKQTLQVTGRWKITNTYGPLLSVQSVLPSFVYELETEAKESTKESIPFGFRVTKVTVKSRKGVKPAQLEAAKKAAKLLEGVPGSFSINARGIVEAFAIDAPPDASLLVHDMIAQIERGIRLASLPLPAEPIGKGATWKATQATQYRTARSRQTSTFELLGVKGNRIRATSTYGAETPEQTIEMPGSPNGAPFLLGQLEFSGGAEGTWRLNQLGPGAASEETITAFGMTATKPKREVALVGIESTIEVKAQR